MWPLKEQGGYSEDQGQCIIILFAITSICSGILSAKYKTRKQKSKSAESKSKKQCEFGVDYRPRYLLLCTVGPTLPMATCQTTASECPCRPAAADQICVRIRPRKRGLLP
jgi:hypothetical protein